VAPAQAEQVAL
jgi:hypothetical protein